MMTRHGRPQSITSTYDGAETMSATYYYSQDGLDTVRTLTDTAGAIQNKHSYTAFGERYAPLTNVTVEQRYTYTGRELNPVSDSMYYRYRTYEASLGRFGERDPYMALIKPKLLPKSELKNKQQYRKALINGFRDGSDLYIAYFVPHSRDSFGLGCLCSAASVRPTTPCDEVHLGKTTTTTSGATGTCFGIKGLLKCICPILNGPCRVTSVWFCDLVEDPVYGFDAEPTYSPMWVEQSRTNDCFP